MCTKTKQHNSVDNLCENLELLISFQVLFDVRATSTTIENKRVSNYSPFCHRNKLQTSTNQFKVPYGAIPNSDAVYSIFLPTGVKLLVSLQRSVSVVHNLLEIQKQGSKRKRICILEELYRTNYITINGNSIYKRRHCNANKVLKF